MVEIVDASGQSFLERVLSSYPDIDHTVETRQFQVGRVETMHTCLAIASMHPTIKAPFVVQLEEYLPMYWHRGYFFDHIGEDNAQDAFNFLVGFFEEEILYGVRVQDDTVFGGGPIQSANVLQGKTWLRNSDETVEIRSWRGTYDQDLRL